MPSIASSLKDTGAIDFTLEETDETTMKKTQNCDKEDGTSSEVNNESSVIASTVHLDSDLSFANITIHEPPKEMYDTFL